MNVDNHVIIAILANHCLTLCVCLSVLVNVYVNYSTNTAACFTYYVLHMNVGYVGR